VGCHENRNSAPPINGPARALALQRPPSKLDGWYGAPRFFSYEREVQPVFDKYCIECHDYGKSAADKLILAGDPDLVFNASYNELLRKGLIHVVGAGPAQVQSAFSWGSHASKLVKRIQENYHLDAESFDRIVTWLDLNAPYYPSYGSAYPDNPGGRSPLSAGEVARLTELTGIKFVDYLDWAKALGPQISFARPDLSPCLAGLSDRSPGAYQEALAIIRTGGERLAQRPHPYDDPAQLCATDQEREKKYQARRAIELANREAVRSGTKRYDQ
ncbi:MAG: hypothetical protein K1Y02_03905, partial [Candidatus Hydrogenedentes bacterium]|nr:hypothetical protein [Candidatus Hydrogenedentota bacterium]